MESLSSPTPGTADLQILVDRLDRIEAAITRPNHGPSMGLAAAEAPAPPRLVSTMERIAFALQVIARVGPRAAPANAALILDPSSPAATDEVLRNDREDRGRKAGRTTGNGVSPLERIETMLVEIGGLLKKQEKQSRETGRKSFTVDEVAEATGFTPWTIRDACNKGRIEADKGPDRKWRISHETLLEIQDKGLPKACPETTSP